MSSERKTLKFADPLAVLIAEGSKRTTWRIHDEKKLTEGDEIGLVHQGTGRLFGVATITGIADRTFATLTTGDYNGHEPFDNADRMYSTYAGYYACDVGPETPVRVVHFDLRLVCTKPGSDETDVIVVG